MLDLFFVWSLVLFSILVISLVLKRDKTGSFASMGMWLTVFCVSSSLSRPHLDDCKSRKNTKYCITKQGPNIKAPQYLTNVSMTANSIMSELRARFYT